MLNEFSRSAILLGADGLDKLSKSRVAVFGIGGVGGYAVEALARTGVGALDLFDNDVVCATNLNRQIIATRSAVGQSKTQVMRTRVADINPDCKVVCHGIFVLPENCGDLDFSAYDYVVDAVDTVAAKLAIITRAKSCGVPVISCMGAGNKLDATAFRVADISQTRVCPLAKVMRKELKTRHITGVKVVYSEEEPREKLFDSGEVTAKRATVGSVAFVPSVAGLIAAGEVIKDLAGVK